MLTHSGEHAYTFRGACLRIQRIMVTHVEDLAYTLGNLAYTLEDLAYIYMEALICTHD